MRKNSGSFPLPVVGIVLWAVLFLSGAAPAGAQVRVAVSILPQAWFVTNIGDELVEVSVLVGPGHSPATYEPSHRQMADLEQSDLFLAAGVPFEKGLVPRIRALPKAPLVVGPEAADGHHHDGDDPHTWLDPGQAAALADTVSHWLQTIAPQEATALSERCDEVKARLAGVDAQVRDILAPYRGRKFIVFHPAFGHFADAFGLIQVAVEADGHEPGPRHLAEVIALGRKIGVRTVIVQPQFSRKSAGTVAEALGAEIVVLDPLAPDYEANLLHMARTLALRFAVEDEAREES